MNLVELPDLMTPMMRHSVLDKGGIQRGTASVRVDRLGNRHRNTFTYPPMNPEVAARYTTKLKRALRRGLKMYIPLLIKQGVPGSPVVDGAEQTGDTLAVRGFTPNYVAKESFWLTIVDASDRAYLHSVETTVVADGSGEATLQIEPPLRADFADGATIEMGKPFMHGFVDLPAFEVDYIEAKFTAGLTFPLEEYK